MARPVSEETERKKTEESLKNALKQNGLSEKFLEDKVREYMSFYDDLTHINKALKELKRAENGTLKNYTDATAEAEDICRDAEHPEIPGVEAGRYKPGVGR